MASDKINVGLQFLPYDHTRDGDRDFDDEYIITVTRADGKGMDQVEAETTISVYLMTSKLGKIR